MGLWPSKGLELHGFEIKVSRADWLNEIRDPDKSTEFKQYCDRWWLVAPSRKIIKKDLPSDWGFMWVRKGKLVVSKGAPKLKPQPLPRGFLAAILRCAKRESPGDEERKAIACVAREEEAKRLARLNRSGSNISQSKLKHLQEAVTAFEERSGIRIHEWNGAKLGDDVALMNRIIDAPVFVNRYRTIVNQITKLAEQAQESMTVIEGLEDEEE
jgi:hypothetical protein